MARTVVLPLSLSLGLSLSSPAAWAEAEPPPPATPPAAPAPPAPPATPPLEPMPPSVYGAGNAVPGYAPPGYPPPVYPPQPPQPYYPYAPPPPPLPMPPPKELRFSLRYDPFDLIERRLTFQGEVAIYKLFAIEVVPSWIWGSPYSGVSGAGWALAGRAVFYLSGEAFRGLWLKAQAGYESYTASFTNPGDSTSSSPPQRLSSAVLGVLFGDTWVIPRDGGFALSGGFGIAFATAPTATLTAPATANAPAAQTTLYDGFDKVRLLGSIGLGIAF